jgi:hypothetical protein
LGLVEATYYVPDMGVVVVVTGPPGSGKSAMADRLVNQFEPSALVAGDDFFAFLRSGAIRPGSPKRMRRTSRSSRQQPRRPVDWHRPATSSTTE